MKLWANVASLKAATMQAGTITETKGYYSSGDGGQARYLIQTAAEYGGTPDEYGDHTLANGNVAVLQIEGAVNVKQFGAVGDGVTDDSAAIQAALDTKRHVFIAGGQYYCGTTLKPHKQQIIQGEGGVQRGYTTEKSVTRLIFPADTTGFDNVPNIAVGCQFRNLMIKSEDQTNGSGAIGIKIGTKGVSGGSSQGIKCRFDDVDVTGFDINFGLYGYSWEVTFNRCFSNYARSVGFDLADSTTIVTMTDCSALQTGFTYGTAPSTNSCVSYQFDGSQVYMYSPRSENSLGNGWNLLNKAKVTVDSVYCEGNRFIDFNCTSTFAGQLIITGGRMIHENDGVTTSACVKSTATAKAFIHVNGVQFQVGQSSTNTITSGFFYSENATPKSIIENLIVEGDVSEMSSGNKKVVYLSQSGRYPPSEFSVTDFPNVKFYAYGTSHYAHIEGSLPTSLLISDGTNTFDMLTDNSTAQIKGKWYRWVAAKGAWALVTMRSFGIENYKNSGNTGLTEWWGTNQGISIVRFSGGPSTLVYQIDTTGASEGADFWVRTFSTSTTPATITVNDHNGTLIGTVTPVATTPGGAIGYFSYRNKIGVGAKFQHMYTVQEAY